MAVVRTDPPHKQMLKSSLWLRLNSSLGVITQYLINLPVLQFSATEWLTHLVLIHSHVKSHLISTSIHTLVSGNLKGGVSYTGRNIFDFRNIEFILGHLNECCFFMSSIMGMYLTVQFWHNKNIHMNTVIRQNAMRWAIVLVSERRIRKWKQHNSDKQTRGWWGARGAMWM